MTVAVGVVLVVAVVAMVGCASGSGPQPQSVHVPDSTLPPQECGTHAADVRANAETVQDRLADYEQALLVGTRADVQTAYDTLMAMRDPARATGYAYRRGCHSGDHTAELSRLTNLALIETYGVCVADLAAEGMNC